METEEQLLATFEDNLLHHLDLGGRLRYRVGSGETMLAQGVDVLGSLGIVTQAGVSLGKGQIDLGSAHTDSHVGEACRRSGRRPDGCPRPRIVIEADGGSALSEEEAVAQVVRFEEVDELGTDDTIIIIGGSFGRPSAGEPHVAQDLGIVVVGIDTIASNATVVIDFVVVDERVVELERLERRIACLLPIAMEEIDLGKQAISVGSVGMIDIERGLLKQRYGCLEFADHEVIDLGHRALDRSEFETIVVHDAHAAIGSCRGRGIGLGKGVDSDEVVPCAIGAGLGLRQGANVVGAWSSVDVVDDEVAAQDVAVHVLVEIVVGDEATLRILVGGEEYGIDGGGLEADDLRLLGPEVVAQIGERRGIIAALGIGDELVIGICVIDGQRAQWCNVNVAVAGRSQPRRTERQQSRQDG